MRKRRIRRAVTTPDELNRLQVGSVIAEIAEPNAPAVAVKDRWGYWRFGVNNERAYRSEELMPSPTPIVVLYEAPKWEPDHSTTNNKENN